MGFMKYALEMNSGAMIYIPSFTQTGFSHSKVYIGGYTDTQRAM
jgi:hypothetical protein